MEAFGINQYEDRSCDFNAEYTLEDYAADAPRWCKGCGDFGVLSAVQKILRDRQVEPHDLACVSGIGCSSRFPYYLRAYGFHGIHGRALTISTGASIARPDLHILTVMGDGDCFSIGAGHWIHTLRNNVRLLVLVLDNEIYALTKNQTSPTTKLGTKTSTAPRGAYLRAMNPLSIMLGISNASFLAQTASWVPGHMADTLNKAWDHNGLAFVRILQKCPIFSPHAFTSDGTQSMPMVFLENGAGIPVDDSYLRFGQKVQHDQHDLNAAQHIAHRGNHPEGTELAGLIYYNDQIPVYNEIRDSAVDHLNPDEKVARFNSVLDRFTV